MDADLEAARAACTRFLGGHGPLLPAAQLARLAAEAGEDDADRYGDGRVITDFEASVADLLGHPAAVFLPSGTMAQQIALRIHADHRGRTTVAWHPRCHLDRHEERGYQRLHGLHGVPVGDENALLSAADLESVAEPPAALVLELPQRELGGQLPPWADLVAQVQWARERGAAVHLDGARLWEASAGYGRSCGDIAGLFDSAYVSFYKGLGGIAGCALTGSAEFVAQARVWQVRHGGRLFSLYPYVLAARAGLRERLGRMPAYLDKAREIAGVLSDLPGIQVVPDPPQTPMLHLLLPRPPEQVRAAALALAADTGVWTFGFVATGDAPGWSRVELSVGDATLDFSGSEVRGIVDRLCSG